MYLRDAPGFSDSISVTGTITATAAGSPPDPSSGAAGSPSLNATLTFNSTYSRLVAQGAPHPRFPGPSDGGGSTTVGTKKFSCMTDATGSPQGYGALVGGPVGFYPGFWCTNDDSSGTCSARFTDGGSVSYSPDDVNFPASVYPISWMRCAGHRRRLFDPGQDKTFLNLLSYNDYEGIEPVQIAADTPSGWSNELTYDRTFVDATPTITRLRDCLTDDDGNVTQTEIQRIAFPPYGLLRDDGILTIDGNTFTIYAVYQYQLASLAPPLPETAWASGDFIPHWRSSTVFDVEIVNRTSNIDLITVTGTGEESPPASNFEQVVFVPSAYKGFVMIGGGVSLSGNYTPPGSPPAALGYDWFLSFGGASFAVPFDPTAPGSSVTFDSSLFSCTAGFGGGVTGINITGSVTVQF